MTRIRIQTTIGFSIVWPARRTGVTAATPRRIGIAHMCASDPDDPELLYVV